MGEADPRVLVADQERVRTVTINVPAKRNAIDVVTRDELAQVLAEAMDDPEVRALVLTGAGGTFSSGGDVSQMPRGKTAGEAPGETGGEGASGARARLEIMGTVVRHLVAGPKPVVAAVEGYAFGAGLSLVAACDHVVAARNARFCCAFGRVGLLADAGALWTLPQRVGLGAAKELLMFSDVIDAERAHALGLVDHVTEPGDALRAAGERAARLADAAPLPIAKTKEMLARWPLTVDEVLDEEVSTQARLWASADFAEGAAAFLERRAPRFEGK
ncbi:MAG: enoyl-CoA hydratase [Streptosporangiales bacterium]|nr:enoyl-CoA hydratase [Streptosporangiales bacterium]